MAETKWTPGPWQHVGLEIRMRGRGVIARTPTPPQGGVFDCSANARLIAVAPELYAELDKLVRCLDSDGGAAFSLKPAIAILAKARGETPDAK